MEYKIAVAAGDGIGPEIVEQAIIVLERIGEKFGHKFTYENVAVGGAAIDCCGDPLPKESLEVCKKSDAVLLGAVGGPKWDSLESSKRPEKGLLRLRQSLGLYANIRPAVLYKELKDACPLKESIIKDGIDICVMRELMGGIYFGERGQREGQYGPEAFDVECYSEYEVERIARSAFEMASKRRKKVTSVDKANVLESSRLWRRVVEKVAAEFPDIELEHMYVDNASMQLIKNPSGFDVLLTTNMFGDILSDEASMITGSIGMLPSASLGTEGVHMYEPIHGSAPDIAGTRKANPIATILSCAMMLRDSFNLSEEANAVEKAVAGVLAKGLRTPDIMSQGMTLVDTVEMGEEIAKLI